jgi:Lamin Tail Domain
MSVLMSLSVASSKGEKQVKIKLSRPTVAGALAACLLSVGLVGASVPAAFAAGANTETSRLTTGALTVDPLQLTGTAASEVERIHVRLDDFVNNPLEFDIAMGQSAGVDPTSVAEQNWTQDIALSDLSTLTDGVIQVTTSFFDINGVDLEDVPGFTVLDLHAPTITSDHSSGQVPAGTQVNFASPDADASLFFTVSHGGTAAQPANTDTPVTGPITVTDAMQIKVLATDFVNDVVQTFNFTVPVPAVNTATTLSVSPASPQVAGTALTLTASVSPTAAGTFEYFDGTTSLGTGASKSVTPAAGSHSYTAKFTPTNPALFNASTSAAKAVTITPAPAAANTVTTLTVSGPASQVEGSALTLTASESPTAAGSFEYFDGATSLGTGASKSVTPSVGSHSFKAVFTPTNVALFNSSTSTVSTVTITAKPVVVPPGVPPVVVPPVVTPPVVVPPVVLPPVVKHEGKVAKLAVMRVSAAGNEFVKVKNIGRISVNLKGYQLRDRSGHVLTLPSYTLKPGSSVKVFTGTGKAAAGKLFLKKTTNVWSTRDTASLFNTKGLKVGSLRY